MDFVIEGGYIIWKGIGQDWCRVDVKERSGGI